MKKDLQFICIALGVSSLMLLSQCKNDNGATGSQDQSVTDGAADGTDGFRRSMDDDDRNEAAESERKDSIQRGFDTLNKPMP